jgi:hypothetical protein
MIQEVHDQRSVDMLELQLRWWNVHRSAGVFKEKPERVGVGVAGVGAGTSLDGQALLKKSCDVRCDENHGRSPVKKLWVESAMDLIKSGVACKYQYVSATLL